MDKLKAQGKPFDISKREVWEAFQEVKKNKGAPGVDGVTIEEFETDLKNNLYNDQIRLSDSREHMRRRGLRGALLCEPWFAVHPRTSECHCVPLDCGNVPACSGPCVLVTLLPLTIR